ncbi:MAG: hypothetical protein JW888_06450 [Pirellulales bacterium]|nr:hypothetical protein [Pirellulales bacterium]
MKRWIFGWAMVVMFGLVCPIQASVVMYLGGDEFSGTNVPIADQAVRVVFEDVVGEINVVRLTIDALDLPVNGSTKIDQCYFNVDNADLLGELVFNYCSGVEASETKQGQQGQSYVENNYQADGDGKYDLFFTWIDPFKEGATSVYEILLVPGSTNTLSETTFDILGIEGPGENKPGPFRAALHLNAVDETGESGFYGTIEDEEPVGNDVPEPATLVIWSLLAAMAWAAARWRKR